MGRKRLAITRSIISVSLEPGTVQMLNKLADVFTNGNRSRYLEGIIEYAATNDLGVQRTLTHDEHWKPGKICNKNPLGRTPCGICWPPAITLKEYTPRRNRLPEVIE